ncbi:hypothetical protein HY387_00295 [Candidatus Daviesbacteria bacterium]|nr:hypothetical protein [Candidatus Daviesbacteria bacterium]
MSKPALLVASLAVILVSSYLVYTNRTREHFYKPGVWPEADKAIDQAKRLFQIRKNLSEDLSGGPCLSNDLIPGWVADVAHRPRQAMDDLAQNQCSAYLEGRAKHFVELDIQGNLIRVK